MCVEEEIRAGYSSVHLELMGGRTMRQRCIRAALLGPILVALVATASARGDYEEYRVKAAFLLNFARMVEWPPAARPKPSEPLVLGVYGDRRVRDRIAEELEGKRVDEHPVEVRALPSRQEMTGCHIVFVAQGDDDAASAWARATADAPVLTVGETEEFARGGGVIRLFLEDGKLRFEINPRAAERRGLKISSRLLRLARLVEQP